MELDNYSCKELQLPRHLRSNETINGCLDGSNFLLLRSSWLVHQLRHVRSDQSDQRDEPYSTDRTGKTSKIHLGTESDSPL